MLIAVSIRWPGPAESGDIYENHSLPTPPDKTLAEEIWDFVGQPPRLPVAF
jgi:hypothetical protein